MIGKNIMAIHTIFRVHPRSHKVIEEFIEGNETEKIVIIQPPKTSYKNIIQKKPDIKIVPIKLRLIKYTISETTYTLVTTLLDRNKYKAEEFSDVYHSRWGVEELYKISKELIDVEDFHSQTERGVKQELFAHFALITLNRIFVNHAEDKLLNEPNRLVKKTVSNIFQSVITK